MENHNTKQDVNIGKIQTELTFIKEQVGSINEKLDNHISCTYRKIDEIKKVFNQRPTWLISGLITLLIGLIVFLLTK